MPQYHILPVVFPHCGVKREFLIVVIIQHCLRLGAQAVVLVDLLRSLILERLGLLLHAGVLALCLGHGGLTGREIVIVPLDCVLGRAVLLPKLRRPRAQRRIGNVVLQALLTPNRQRACSAGELLLQCGVGYPPIGIRPKETRPCLRNPRADDPSGKPSLKRWG